LNFEITYEAEIRFRKINNKFIVDYIFQKHDAFKKFKSLIPKSNLKFLGNILTINFDEKFLPRRGRVNCSLNDDGKWRWFGTQFIVTEN